MLIQPIAVLIRILLYRFKNRFLLKKGKIRELNWQHSNHGNFLDEFFTCMIADVLIWVFVESSICYEHGGHLLFIFIFLILIYKSPRLSIDSSHSVPGFQCLFDHDILSYPLFKKLIAYQLEFFLISFSSIINHISNKYQYLMRLFSQFRNLV